MEKKLTMWTTAVANGYLQAHNRNDGDANNSGTAGAIDSVGSIRRCGSFGLTALLLGEESLFGSQRRNALLT